MAQVLHDTATASTCDKAYCVGLIHKRTCRMRNLLLSRSMLQADYNPGDNHNPSCAFTVKCSLQPKYRMHAHLQDEEPVVVQADAFSKLRMCSPF
jgi:hypothetical protein